MEKLVRDESEEATIITFERFGGIRRGGSGAIAAANAKTETRVTARGGVLMFVSAARIRSQVKNERVVVIRNLTAH
jgi:hypothetical protein